ncbi:hypothetical protein L0F63_003096 [Massospora cicadina]|nr:hypothetical protein L0F63_003096 [Massospora cicadina]
MAERSNRRQEIYKNKEQLKPEEIRRRRGEAQIVLRRQKREENLLKKLPIREEDVGPATLEPQLVSQLYENNVDVILQAVTLFRKLLSKETNPPIEDVIQAGVVPRLVELLKVDNPSIQFESAWALTNIASGTSEQTQIVLESGNHPDVREQAVWALGNISGDSPACRDYVLDSGALQPLLRIFEEDHKLTMLRMPPGLFPTFVAEKSLPTLGKDALAKLVYSTDIEIVTDACWGLSYLTDGSNDKIQRVLETGVTRRLVELLMHNSPTLQTPALRTIGNIVTGMTHKLRKPSQGGLLDHFQHHCRKHQSSHAVVESGLFAPLVSILINDDFKTQKEACWAISNATTCLVQRSDLMDAIVSFGVIQPLCDILTCTDAKILQVALDAIENILKTGEYARAHHGYNPYVPMVEEARGIDRLNELQTHGLSDIFQKAFNILETYFKDQDDMDGMDDAMGGQIDEATGKFAFDASMPQGGFSF